MPVQAPSSSQKTTMSAAQFSRLQQIIFERSGIYFQDSKKDILESRLGHRLGELDMGSYDEYIMFITIGPYRDDEFQEMFNRITTNETSFFRNEPQLNYFEQEVLPVLLEAKSATKRLRIWSCACSSGEEPYTLAIQLHRSLGVRLADWHIEILGTDISEKMLKVGQTARYSSHALRSTADIVKSRYFNEVNGFFDLDPEIQSMVYFEKLNLKDRLSALRFGTFDVVFCRDVLIYFNDEMKQHCADLFERTLADDGYLFLGHSETLRGLKSPFEAISVPHTFCWRKMTATSTKNNGRA
ncbi:MAG: hypothetical protein KAS72_11375 [Phycisphaerales bacterium]|nr:hypothetical protein [Phycisphaerales bacterium]